MAGPIQLQCLLGIQCKDFAMIAADQTTIQSVIILKNDENKLYEVADKMVMGAIGDQGVCTQLTQFVTKNLALYKMRNRYLLDTPALVHFTRKNLADSFRGGVPLMINTLIAGYDEKNGGQLYYLDFLASCMKVPFAVHGFGGNMVLSIFDRFYKYNLSESEAYEIFKACVHEIHRRLFISLPSFQVKSVSRHGIKQLPKITMNTYK